MGAVAITDAFIGKIALVVDPFAIGMEDVKIDEGQEGHGEDLEADSQSFQRIRKITFWVAKNRMDSN